MYSKSYLSQKYEEVTENTLKFFVVDDDLEQFSKAVESELPN